MLLSPITFCLLWIGWNGVIWRRRHSISDLTVGTPNQREAWPLTTYTRLLIAYGYTTPFSSHMRSCSSLGKDFVRHCKWSFSFVFTQMKWKVCYMPRLWCYTWVSPWLVCNALFWQRDRRTLEESVILNWSEYVTECSGIYDFEGMYLQVSSVIYNVILFLYSINSSHLLS